MYALVEQDKAFLRDEDSWSLRNQSTPAELRGHPLRLSNASLRLCRRWLAVPFPSSRCALHARAGLCLIAVFLIVFGPPGPPWGSAEPLCSAPGHVLVSLPVTSARALRFLSFGLPFPAGKEKSKKAATGHLARSDCLVPARPRGWCRH